MQDVSLQTALPDMPARPRLRWWDMVLPIASGVLMFAVISVGIVVIALGKGDAGFAQEVAAKMQSPNQAYFLNMGLMAVLYLPPLGVLFWIARRKQLEYFAHVPWRLVGSAFGVGILCVIAFELVQNFLISYSIVTYTPSPAELLLVPHNLTQLALALMVAVLLGPLVEEFYFRGFLLSWCRTKMPLAAATLLNAALFGIVHFYFLQHQGLEGVFITSAIGALGALNVWWTVRTKSLWPAFATHAAYNGVSLIMAFLVPGMH